MAACGRQLGVPTALANCAGSTLIASLHRTPYPLPGIAAPADVARLMAWLLSNQAPWITGQVWAVDGGFSSVRPLVK